MAPPLVTPNPASRPLNGARTGLNHTGMYPSSWVTASTWALILAHAAFLHPPAMVSVHPAPPGPRIEPRYDLNHTEHLEPNTRAAAFLHTPATVSDHPSRPIAPPYSFNHTSSSGLYPRNEPRNPLNATARGGAGPMNAGDSRDSATGHGFEAPRDAHLLATHRHPAPSQPHGSLPPASRMYASHPRTIPLPPCLPDRPRQRTPESGSPAEPTPPPHTRPLYKAIPLPPVEETVAYDGFVTWIIEEDAVVGLVSSSPATDGVEAQMRNPNPMEAFLSAQQRVLEWSASVREEGRPRNALRGETMAQPTSRVERASARDSVSRPIPRPEGRRGSAPEELAARPNGPSYTNNYLSSKPILNLIQLHAALRLSGHSSSAANRDRAALLQERRAPATTPAVGHLTLVARSSGQCISVSASGGIVTVGDVLDTLREVYRDYLAGCGRCGGALTTEKQELRPQELLRGRKDWIEGKSKSPE
ncbi:hypothetical protein FPV67DRAFT_1449074 [Lyophyllum atratum]|nr:hypothetical protein FPV67DRAFT_1449074 [Lyophyllum atratum]